MNLLRTAIAVMRSRWRHWRRSKLTETTRSVLWLWDYDRAGWISTWSSALTQDWIHHGAGISVKIMDFGLADVPDVDVLDHSEIAIRLPWRDRRALNRAMGPGHNDARQPGASVPFAISEWAMKDDLQVRQKERDARSISH